MAESVFDKIGQGYYDLTAAEKRTADFILANRDRCQYLSIAELAELSGVAEATVSRFCRRLGYKGFNAFKLAIANASSGPAPDEDLLSGPIEASDSVEEMCQKLYSAEQDALRQTLELIEPDTISRAAELLRQAGRVVCMGQGGSMLLAEVASHLFSTVSGKFSAIADSHSQVMTAVNMDPGDAILFFSWSGATRDMLDTMRAAKTRGVALVLITRFPKSPGAELSDLVLCCGSNEGPLQLGSVPAKIAQLFLMDVLFSEFCRRDLKTCRQCKERIAAAIENKHL
ncbi:MAG: MurR/RpiR family transcriptional regulator [Oscillospiraceae bacterium]|nr:MurR/RpiR family transcriptional regulator [Oscillospiraceae bacterium]